MNILVRDTLAKSTHYDTDSALLLPKIEYKPEHTRHTYFIYKRILVKYMALLHHVGRSFMHIQSKIKGPAFESIQQTRLTLALQCEQFIIAHNDVYYMINKSIEKHFVLRLS